jgi:uncharacterized protein (DUF488 family)
MTDSESHKEIWTIGHSTHPLKEFVEMLQSAAIEVVVDIRSLPGSNKFPQFNKEALEKSLSENGIEYLHLENLGGRRKTKPDSKNMIWRNKSFRGYADYMETAQFKEGLKKLQSLALEKHTAMMCSEAVWWRCHRSMVSDELKAQDWKVWHIMGVDKVTEHPYTQPAKIVNGELSYHTDTE